jgi:hypothetical protein
LLPAFRGRGVRSTWTNKKAPLFDLSGAFSSSSLRSTGTAGGGCPTFLVLVHSVHAAAAVAAAVRGSRFLLFGDVGYQGFGGEHEG